MTVSATAQTGLTEAWAEMQTLAAWRREKGHWQARRAAQARHAFEEEVRHGLLAALATGPARTEMDRLGRAVETGQTTPEAAAASLLQLLGRR
jgi:LAO/AO transport system kinase